MLILKACRKNVEIILNPTKCAFDVDRDEKGNVKRIIAYFENNQFAIDACEYERIINYGKTVWGNVTGFDSSLTQNREKLWSESTYEEIKTMIKEATTNGSEGTTEPRETAEKATVDKPKSAVKRPSSRKNRKTEKPADL